MDPTSLKSKTAKTTQNLVRQAAWQMAQEPLEVLKTARSQIGGREYGSPEPEINTAPPAGEPDTEVRKLQEEEKTRTSSNLQRLESELLEIRRERILGQLQQKIAQGEEVYLENFPELSIEQSQVLRAEMEAVRLRKQQEELGRGKTLFEPATKRPRGLLFGGPKLQAERQRTKVEKPIPPSG